MLGEGRMAAEEVAGRAAGSSRPPHGLVTDARAPSSEREQRVRALSAFLRTHLGPYEPVWATLQATLTWEKPARSALGWIGAHAAFGFFALTSLHLIFLVAFTLILIVCLDQWKNRIWPEIKAVRPDQLDNGSWGFVHPRILSVPELCQFLAKGWITGDSFMRSLLSFKKQNPGKNRFGNTSELELKGLDNEISELSCKVQTLQQNCRHMESELKELKGSMTTPEMVKEIEELKKDCANYTEKLERIKSAANHVSPEEKEKATELLDAILEGYPKSKKQFFEEVGIETDEDFNVTVPSV